MLAKAKVALAALASTMIVAPAGSQSVAAGASTFAVPLSGLDAVPSPAGTAGDPDGIGLVRLVVDPDRKRLCYDFRLSGLSTPLMGHIHRGSNLRNGPSVVTLFTGPGDNPNGCVPWTRERLAEIVSQPSNFYVNVATTEFPDGALRGQLPS